MSELKVSSFGEAQELASKFDQAAQDLASLIAFTDLVGGQLQGIWEGAAIENFMDNYEEIKASLNKMVPIVAEMKTVADQKLAALIAANQ